jgi:AraC-like DNA-binding protein
MERERVWADRPADNGRRQPETTPDARPSCTGDPPPEYAIHALPLRHRLGGYREYLPPAPLAASLESVWTYLTPSDAGEDARHRVLPDPALSLAFACRRETDGRPADPQMLLIGPKSRPFQFRPCPGYQLVAIRLKLEWVEPLLDLLPAEHAEVQRDLGSLLPRLTESALQRLTDTRTPDQATSVLTDVVRTWAEPRHRPGVEGAALDLLRDAEGRVPIDGIAARTGASARHLRRTVRRRAGISLKQYGRTMRFLAAVARADRALVPRWARIAAEAGFCDQSHLVRESRALCGLAPAAVDRERRSEAGTSNRRGTCRP